MASIGKAYTSIACGIVLHEKRAEIPEGLDQKVFNAKYLPEALPLTDPARADIRLGHLLSMSSGMHGDGTNPGFARGVPANLLPWLRRRTGWISTATPSESRGGPRPGEGYSYSSSSPHVASMVLRRLAGMELQQYLEEKLAKPMGWGAWGYALHRNGATLPHTPGGGSIAVRATDALRFACLPLRNGKWGKEGATCASDLCGSLARCGDLQDGGQHAQFDPALTRIPANYAVDHSRDDWKPVPHRQIRRRPDWRR